MSSEVSTSRPWVPKTAHGIKVSDKSKESCTCGRRAVPNAKELTLPHTEKSGSACAKMLLTEICSENGLHRICPPVRWLTSTNRSRDLGDHVRCWLHACTTLELLIPVSCPMYCLGHTSDGSHSSCHPGERPILDPWLQNFAWPSPSHWRNLGSVTST